MSDEAEDSDKAPWWRPVTKFLNSPFTIFLLSSVVLGLISRLYADRQAENARAAARAQQRSRLMIELALRDSELEDRINDLVVAVSQRDPNASQVHKCDLPPDKAGAGDQFEIQRGRPLEDRAFRNVQAVVSGASPYSASGPEYANVHLMRLIAELDENRGDTLGARRILFTVPRQRTQWRPFSAMNSAMQFGQPQLCQLVHLRRDIQIYYGIRSSGGCEPTPDEAGHLVCHGGSMASPEDFIGAPARDKPLAER